MNPAQQTALFQGCLEAVLHQVLAVSYGCTLLPLPSDPSAAQAECLLPLVIDGTSFQLVLQSGHGWVERLLPRILGRAVSSEEVLAMASEVPAEVCNLLGGQLAGLLGEQGLLVTLGTPQCGPAPTQKSVVAPVAHGRWSCDGQPLTVSLNSRSLG
jgi:hypothetical protein